MMKKNSNENSRLEQIQRQKQEVLRQIRLEGNKIKVYSDALISPFMKKPEERPVTVMGKVANALGGAKHAFRLGKGIVSLLRFFH